MDGVSGNNGRSFVGADVGKNLPPSGLSNTSEFAQHSVRRVAVSRNLMQASLKKKAIPARSLDQFRLIHQIDPNRSISEELEAQSSGELSLDDERPFMSIQNGQFDEFGRRIERDESSDQVSGGVAPDFSGVDVMAALSPATLSNLRPSGLMDVEASLDFSMLNSLPQTSQEVDKTPTQSLIDDQTEIPDDEGDEVFYSLHSVQQALEETVAASLMPSSQAPSPSGGSLVQALESFSAAVVENQNTQDRDISTALNKVLDHYPAVTNREKVISMLMREVEALEDAEQITTTCQQLLQHFKTAGEVSLDHPEEVFEKGLPDVEALQTLMILRQRAIDNKLGTEEHLAEIETLMTQELTKRLGPPVAKRAGLGIDPENPDYSRYARLQEASGLFSVPEKEAGPGIRREVISAGKEIPIKPNFRLGKVPEAVSGTEARIHGADVMGVMAVKYATEHPDGDIAQLMKMDAWLSDDGDEKNLISHLMGKGLEKTFLEKAEALGFVSELQDRPSAAKPKGSKRVMFSDHEGVIPRDQVKLMEAGKEYVHVNDLVKPSRDMMSHISVVYVDRLVQLIKMDNEYTGRFVGNLQALAEESLTALPARKQEIRKKLMSTLDNIYDVTDQVSSGSTAKYRTNMIRSLPYVKAGLLDADATMNMYQTHLENAVVSCLMPLIGKAQKRPVYKYKEEDRVTAEVVQKVQNRTRSPVLTRDRNGDSSVKPFLVPNRVRRGAPSTPDMLAELSSATRPYHQAMEASLSSQAAFCHSLSQINDPKTMLALRSRMNKEGKNVGLYLDNWGARMGEVMCSFQATQILESIDSHVKGKAVAQYSRDGRASSTAPDDFVENMMAVCVEDTVRDIQAGRFQKPGVIDAQNFGLERVWRQLAFIGSMDNGLKQYMPTPDRLLSELEGHGVISKAEPDPTGSVSQPGSSEGLGWIVNTVSGWFSGWTASN